MIFSKGHVNVILAWVYRSPPPWQPRRSNSLHLPGLFTRRVTFTCKCSLSYRRLRHKFSSSAFSFTEYEELNSKHGTHQCTNIIFKESLKIKANLPLATPPSWASQNPLTWRWANRKRQTVNHHWQLECLGWALVSSNGLHSAIAWLCISSALTQHYS